MTYRIRVTAPESGVFEVEAVFPAPEGRSLLLIMPAFTRGNFQQDHSHFVRRVRALDSQGGALPCSRTDANSWTVHEADDEVIVTYEVLCDSKDDVHLTNNDLTATDGVFVPSSLLMYAEEFAAHPASLKLTVPAGWSAVGSLEPDDVNHWTAASYAELAEALFLIGDVVDTTLTLAGVELRLASTRELPKLDLDRFEAWTRGIFASYAGVFEEAPVSHLTLLLRWRQDLDYGGGISRANGILMNIGSEWAPNIEGNMIGTFAHELFHVWNNEAFYIAPRSLDRFITGETTPLLWFVEGTANYYAMLSLARPGIISEEVFLDIMAGSLGAYLSHPDRGWVSLHESSLAADVDPVEALGAYGVGQLVAFLLDVEIRRATSGENSLDDVMRALYLESKHDGYEGYTEESLIGVLSEVAGEDMTDVFDRYVLQRAGFDPTVLLSEVGLDMETSDDGQGGLQVTLRPSAPIGENFVSELLQLSEQVGAR